MLSPVRTTVLDWRRRNRPFTLAIFAAISSAISPCNLLAIPRRYFTRHEIALEIAAKIASVNGP